MAWTLAAALVGAAGSVLSAYIAAKVRGVATILNGRTEELRQELNEVKRLLAVERTYNAPLPREP